MRKDHSTRKLLLYEAPSTQTIEYSLEGVVAQSGDTEQFIPGPGFGESDFN